MTKTAIIFKSKYGTTKKYAQHLAEELSCELFDGKKLKAKDLANTSITNSSTIIYLGALYAGGVAGIKLITESFDTLRDKNLIICTCGLADLMTQAILILSKKISRKFSHPQCKRK